VLAACAEAQGLSVEFELDRVPARRFLVTRLAADRVHQRPLIPLHDLVGQIQDGLGYFLGSTNAFMRITGVCLAWAYSNSKVSRAECASWRLDRAMTASAGVICWRRLSRTASLSPCGRRSGVL